MINQVILFCNLDLDRYPNYYNIQIYKMLKNCFRRPVYLYGEDQEGFHKIIGSHRFTQQPIDQIKDTLIVLFGYSRAFLGLDSSNHVVYFMERSFNPSNLTMIPALDRIITHDYHTAYQISTQVQKAGFHTPVARLLPWLDPNSYEFTMPNGEVLGYYYEVDGDYIGALTNYRTIRTKEMKNLYAYLCLSQYASIKEALAAMLSGVPVIALDQPPFNELIINGYNGYLIRTMDDIVNVLKFLSRDRPRVANNAQALANAALTPYQYCQQFNSILDGNFYNANTIRIENLRKKWIIPSQVLDTGKVTIIPKRYNETFEIADAQDFYDIIDFFSVQIFSEVYVFGCEFGEYNGEQMIRLDLMINRMGDRARKLYFCMEGEIPSKFNKFFDRLGLISSLEGLKQVR